MRLLLDTHTLLWWDGQSALLSDTARIALQDKNNVVFMSVVNAWEMQIKAQLGKLTLHKPLADIVHEQRINNGFELLEVELSHVLMLDSLPFYHKDPFDRLLIAQANHENLTLVSNDSVLYDFCWSARSPCTSHPMTQSHRMTPSRPEQGDEVSHQQQSHRANDSRFSPYPVNVLW